MKQRPRIYYTESQKALMCWLSRPPAVHRGRRDELAADVFFGERFLIHAQLRLGWNDE